MTHPELRDATILAVDDERANLDLLERCLLDEGYRRCITTTDPAEVMELYERLAPDLILLDLHMPRLDGFAVLERLRERMPPGEYLPVLVLTADVSGRTKERALSSGARDFLTKPLDITEVLLRIHNLLETRMLHQQQRAARARAEAAQRRAALLAEASRLLSSSFDYQTTLAKLCRTIVPELADYCVVDMLEAQGITRVGVAHVDPAKEALLEDTRHYQPEVLPAEHPARLALLEGRRTLATEITAEMVAAVSGSEEHRRVIERLAPRSLISVPLTVQRRPIGALTLATSESGRGLEEEDLALADELAHRAALAVENARLYREAQQATRERDEMLAVVAHDLRNPLSTVMMGASLLLDDLGSDPRRRHLETVHRSAERMNRLIEDLLEVTRMARGKLRLEPHPERLAPLLREAAAMLEPLAGAAGIALRCDVPGDLPLVTMDGARVLQVISNLVGNAIKFTPAGGEVRIGCAVLDDEVRVSVSDTGAGISPEQLPHVFGRFWQASDHDRRGVGLGLSIAQGIVEGHGGRIWVESRPGLGSTFCFTLPLTAPASARPPDGGRPVGSPLPQGD